jgi:hypothetical protein
MAEATRVIATFKTPGEAHLAQMQLQGEGIEATVRGDTPNPVDYSIFGKLQYAAQIELSVGVSDVERAQAILADPAGGTQFEEGWEDVAAGAVSGWICRGCDSEVAVEEKACPECGTLRSTQLPEEESEDD